jgi:multiple sugar transport system permease protein
MNRRGLLYRSVREVGLNALGLVTIGVLVFPVWWALCEALENLPNFFVQEPALIPTHLFWGNFSQAFDQVVGNIVTSIIISLCVVVIGLVIGVPAAYGLRRFRVRYGTVVILAMLVTGMIPTIVLGTSFYTMFRPFGLLNSYPGLILADSTYAVPLMVLLLRAYLTSVPLEIFDAARIDGCREMQTLLKVIAPLAVPGMITASLFGFLGAWGDFLFAVTLNAGGSVQPLTLGLFKFVDTHSISYGPIMATAIMAAVPAGAMLSFAQRWIRGGLQAGALKA